MDEEAIRAAAQELWDEATYAADLDEGRAWAAREWETRGDPLTDEQAIDRLVGRIKEASVPARG